MARRQLGIGIAAERPGHRDAAFRYLHIGTDGEILRHPECRPYLLGAPDRRTDEALSLRVVRVLLVKDNALRDCRPGVTAADCGAWVCWLGRMGTIFRRFGDIGAVSDHGVSGCG